MYMYFIKILFVRTRVITVYTKDNNVLYKIRTRGTI